MKIAVIGIGQSLRGDDAVGLNAVRQWQENYPKTACLPELYVDVMENPGLALLDFINVSEAAILVDAVKSNLPAGTLYRLTLDQLSSFTSDSKSAHGWGVSETLLMNRKLYPSSQNIPIRLIGIEGEQYQIGSGLSRIIDQALPLICEIIQEEVQIFLGS